MSELDWGPRRPAAVSWAGVILFLVGLVQLGLLVFALVLDAHALLDGPAYTFSVLFILTFSILEVIVAVGVIRLGRASRTFAIVLAGVGAILQGLHLSAADGDSLLIGLNATFLLAYLVVIFLLLRTRPAFD